MECDRHIFHQKFQTPAQQAHVQEWLEACRISVVAPGHEVPQAHFSSEAFSSLSAKMKRLEANAVPSLQHREGVPDTPVLPASTPSLRPESRLLATRKKLVVFNSTYMILRRAMRKAGLRTVKRTILHLAKGYLKEPDGGDGGRGHASGYNMGGDGDTGDAAHLAMPSTSWAFHVPITSQATKEPADVAWTPSAFTPGGSQGSAWTPDHATILDAAAELEQIDANVEVETAEEEDVNVGATEEDGRPWGTRSAGISEPQLRELAEAAAVLCTRCGARCDVNVTRITVSFTVTWVTAKVTALASRRHMGATP
ncbi:uncharacterized protein LOC119107059 [Pollicipes pollicipes]|uniref:uncharacterized protein LOC119107059 n=1 Tax=Pollicipes pollicipes TaxID=41117 RepID=UPI001884F382|nr:uncharacterized protein LOC119107059 [Pollicipes pollicipes]